MGSSGCISILPPEEARRIAAGEVIDRPAALIREFIDNAIDSGAQNIEVSIEGGGCKKAEVSDDGSGMSRDDLAICWYAHATSKIRCLDDLLTSETLGFRGEALAAAAAVARLEIITSGGEAWRLEVGPGDLNQPRIVPAARTKGSTVRTFNLFDTIPARKQFLKREGSESALCRQIFIEKALAFPQITFRFFQDGRPKDFLPSAPSKKDRFAAAILDASEGKFLHEIHLSEESFSADVVIGGPELFRNDRRMLYVFANGRRIQDYALMQAMEFGVQGLFPNGTHPIGAAYIDIDPALADFNIHPAKREARFKDPGAIHHAISSAVSSFFHHGNVKAAMQPKTGFSNSPEFFSESFLHETGNHKMAMEALERQTLATNAESFTSMHFTGFTAEKVPDYDGIKYAGSVFGLFILIERGNRLFIIDQHAAHERILYNRFLAEPIQKQELLVPVTFTTESIEDDNFLELKKEDLNKLGIAIEKDENSWRIDALPAGWRLGDSETVKKILELRNAGSNIVESWAATLCCHQAIRDGEIIDEPSALSLAEEAFALPDPRCPHGRPIWTEISREGLCKAVRRE